MLSQQRASMGTSIVPNVFVVGLHPKDYAQFADYSGGLSRQMEAWLAQVATQRNLSVVDRIRVSIHGRCLREATQPASGGVDFRQPGAPCSFIKGTYSLSVPVDICVPGRTGGEPDIRFTPFTRRPTQGPHVHRTSGHDERWPGGRERYRPRQPRCLPAPRSHRMWPRQHSGLRPEQHQWHASQRRPDPRGRCRQSGRNRLRRATHVD